MNYLKFHLMLLMLHDAYCLLYLLFHLLLYLHLRMLFKCLRKTSVRHLHSIQSEVQNCGHKLRKSRQRSRDTMLGCFTSSRDCLLMIVSTQWVSSVHRMLQCRRFRGETTHNLTFFISGKLPEKRPKPKSKD